MSRNIKTSNLSLVLLFLSVAVVSFAVIARSIAQNMGRKAPPARVLIKDVRYVPSTVTIRSGGAVEWENVSGLMHTVTADPAKASSKDSVTLPRGASAFDSGELEPHHRFRYTFVIPGTYRYFCIPHEAAGMIGQVEVLPVSVGKK
jgi:plastocyanin